jgi:hypothetical protein
VYDTTADTAHIGCMLLATQSDLIDLMRCVPDSHSIDVRSVTVRLLVEVTWSFASSCEPQREAWVTL